MIKISYKLLPKQELFLQKVGEIPHVAYIGGFGSGKTHILVIQALIEVTQHPGCLGLIGAPTYRLLEDSTLRKFFELCPRNWIENFNKSHNIMHFVNGAEIIFRSLERPERLRNLNLDWFGLDEAGDMSLASFRMLQGRLRRPGGSHHGFCVGNPQGPTHWTYRYFVELAEQYADSYYLVQAPTYENVFNPDSYIKEMERSYGKGSAYYRRYVLGEFAAFEGAYWPDFDIRPYSQGGMIVSSLQEAREKILSPTAHLGKVVDFGYEHPFACLWFLVDSENIVFFDEHHERHMTLLDHARAIQRHEQIHKKEYGLAPVRWAYTDHDAQARAELANATDPLADNQNIGFHCIPADKDVMPSILLVQTLIKNRHLYLTEACSRTRLELPSYRGKPQDRSVDEKPLKENDDTCDCVRMACMMELPHMLHILRSKPADFDVPDNEAMFDRNTIGARKAEQLENEFGGGATYEFD